MRRSPAQREAEMQTWIVSCAGRGGADGQAHPVIGVAWRQTPIVPTACPSTRRVDRPGATNGVSTVGSARPSDDLRDAKCSARRFNIS